MEEHEGLLQSATTEDMIEQIERLATEIWHEHYCTILSNDQIDYMVDKFQSKKAITEQIEKLRYQYYLIQADGKSIGYIGFILEKKKIFLSKFYILKEYRGKGYASQVFDFMKKFAKEQGKQSIWLTVNRYNSNSIAVYLKKGFIKVDEQVEQIGNGYVMDDFIMENKL